MGMALGYLVSRSLHVATELGIADLLKDGPKTVEDLAPTTGTHRESLYRLVRMLGPALEDLRVLAARKRNVPSARNTPSAVSTSIVKELMNGRIFPTPSKGWNG